MKLAYLYLMVALGIALGFFGFVRSGAIVISLSSAALTYLRFNRSKSKRRIELFLPLLLAGTLFVVALTLPHGK